MSIDFEALVYGGILELDSFFYDAKAVGPSIV
jgi:hypothetical protein